MRWVGPNTETVDVIQLTRDGHSTTVYRLRRHGRFVANCETLEQLAEYVDLAALREVE